MTRRRRIQADDPNVQVLREEHSTNRLSIYVDGQEVGHLERARIGWVGHTNSGQQVTGRTANATANRVLYQLLTGADFS